MAHPQLGSSVPTKLSFAKIAAMPAPNMTPALPSIIRENKPRSPANGSQHVRNGSQLASSQELEPISKVDPKGELKQITDAVSGFSLTANEMNESNLHPSGDSADSVADDQSQLSSSSLKQQGFDTKSMASVTTFAMDEKESIRPDDSASVRAVEEDDIHPGLSRNSSFQQETEAQPTLFKSNVRMLGPSVTIAARRQPYTTLTNPPRFGDLPPVPLPETSMPLSRVPVAIPTSVTDEGRPRPPLPNTTPDEKLIEALSSLKDRLPLLQLEEKIISFIQNGRDTVLELPPQNSFTRLLTHKLADYYNLAHHINDDNNSVRIFRTDYCSSPVPLAEIAKSVPIGAQQISYATQVKIMRRVQLGPRQFSAGNSTAASSSVPSKTTSENGIETTSEEGLQSPIEGTPNKDRSKLTREEREAQYKAARDRIFGDFQESVTSESGSTGEASASMSRSSSSSGKKKSRKHKVPKDDTFEARSSFIPSYAPMQMTPAYPQAYHDMQYANGYGPASGTYPATAYSPAPAPNFSPYEVFNNPMGFNAMNVAMYGSVDGWSTQQQPPAGGMYNYQGSQQYPQQIIPQQMNSQYQPNSPSPIPQSPNWSSNQYQSMYMPNPAAANNVNWPGYNQTNMQNTVPYQYGQLPSPTSTSGVSFPNQHPLPGSFTGTKSLFNPQTRSFVPSNTSARGGARGGRKKGQGQGSARTSGASSPAVSNMSDNTSAKPKEDSLQQKYGTPANLPKKPPPSQVSPHFNNDHSAGSTNGPLVVNSNAKNSAV